MNALNSLKWQQNTSNMLKEQNDRTWVEIDLDKYRYNLNQLKKFIPEETGFLQIVKADAYGHSAYNIALEAKKAGALMLGVANVDEASLLKYQGIDLPILILSPITVDEIPIVLENDFVVSVSEIDIAKKLNKQAKLTDNTCKVHINIDTGMNRSGIRWDEIDFFINALDELSNIMIDGVYSHFAASEDDVEFTGLQGSRFENVLAKLKQKPKYIHIANSSAVLMKLTNSCNLVRLGILSFGIYTEKNQSKHIKVKSVLKFKTRIAQIKNSFAGESIGYNRTYKTKTDMKFAVLPLGYADGYDFLLSNRAHVEINGSICPVIGKVSMDMVTVDITNLHNVCVGDEVTLIGGEQSLTSAENLVKSYSGLSYELLCQVGRRAKRYFRSKGKIIADAPLSRRGFYSHDFSSKSLNSVIESALRERLNGSEVSEMVYHSVLRDLFFRHDNNFSYRKDFNHTIVFSEATEYPDLYKIDTTLTFRKTLKTKELLIVCSQTEETLQRYFLRSDVAYRWFLNEEIDLSNDNFKVTEFKINNNKLKLNYLLEDGLIEVKCDSPRLNSLLDKDVRFSISTSTYYPKSKKQFTVYIAELTKGVKIKFEHLDGCKDVEVISVFSGQNRYPEITKAKNSITISTNPDEWIFPTSGIVFVYN